MAVDAWLWSVATCTVVAVGNPWRGLYILPDYEFLGASARDSGVPSAGHCHRDCVFLQPRASPPLGLGAEHLANVGEVLAAPEQPSTEKKSRYAKYAHSLRGSADVLELLPALPRQIRRQSRGI